MVYRISPEYFERTNSVRTFNFLTLGLFLFSLNSLAFGLGTGGSGGSPPAILLPKQQFTTLTLGILRGEQIVIKNDEGNKKYELNDIDTRNGIIKISSPEDGSTKLLLDFEKRFGNQTGILNSFKKIQPGSTVKDRLPAVTIPENPYVTTVPADTEDNVGGGAGSDASPP